MHRALLLVALVAAALVPRLSPAASYGSLGVNGDPVDSARVFVQWQVEADPADTAGTALWYGFDVYRFDLGACGPWVRVTASPVPRSVGTLVTSYSLYDTPPANHAWRYQVRFVSASGAELQPFQFCECYRDLYVACPWKSIPVTEGTLVSNPFGVGLSPCPGSCYPGVGLDVPLPDNLAPLVGTAATVRLYGVIQCGIEGCLMPATNYDFGACGVVPAHTTSWGRLKSIYR